MPAYVVDTAEQARKRLPAADLPCVLGHADFEAQNLRWHDGPRRHRPEQARLITQHRPAHQR